MLLPLDASSPLPAPVEQCVLLIKNAIPLWQFWFAREFVSYTTCLGKEQTVASSVSSSSFSRLHNGCDWHHTNGSPHLQWSGGMCDKNKHCKKNLLFHMLMQNLDLQISQMSESAPSVPGLKKRDWQLHLDNYLWILSISIIYFYSLWMFSHPAFPNESRMLFCTNCDAQHC